MEMTVLTKNYVISGKATLYRKRSEINCQKSNI